MTAPIHRCQTLERAGWARRSRWSARPWPATPSWPMMETHNNLGGGRAVPQDGGYEQLHVNQILADMGWADVVLPRTRRLGHAPDRPRWCPSTRCTT